jgi:hypothetical protein
MTTTSDTRAFWDLRKARLDLYGPEEWKTYDPAMSAWLTHSDPEIRRCAIERLATAVLHWDYRHEPEAELRNRVSAQRIDWLLKELETAQLQWPDTIPEFLRTLRYHGHDRHIAPRLIGWIDEIAKWPKTPADDGLIRGTLLLLDRRTPVTPDHISNWLALLDAPSPYLRGCAAYLLSNSLDDDDIPPEFAERLPKGQTLMTFIGEKELQRPGIAGPYWSPIHIHLGGLANAELTSAALWMMDLLERRQGPPPPFTEMPYNDIDFYLHELCCDSPEFMQRMIDGGFNVLALMTATEINGAVDGVKPILEILACDTDARIANTARAHLKRHYAS